MALTTWSSESTAAPRGNGSDRAYNRQQAASAPTEAAANVERRWREIATLIDVEEDKDKLTDLSRLTAEYATLERMSAELGPATVHAERMGLLETRAARRREKLVGSLDAFDGR